MEYCRLGHSGLEVSRLGRGARGGDQNVPRRHDPGHRGTFDRVTDPPEMQMGVDQARAAHAMPRLTISRAWAPSKSFGECPHAAKNILPSPHGRVQAYGITTPG